MNAIAMGIAGFVEISMMEGFFLFYKRLCSHLTMLTSFVFYKRLCSHLTMLTNENSEGR